jgi:hypothetical protein
MRTSRKHSEPRAGHAWSELVVARGYLEHGFIDVAIRLIVRNGARASTGDWRRLVAKVLAQGRIADAVELSARAGLPVPRAEVLALGDARLRRKDVDGALHWYGVGDADAERWSHLVDSMVELPGRELQARAVAARHLVPPADDAAIATAV